MLWARAGMLHGAGIAPHAAPLRPARYSFWLTTGWDWQAAPRGWVTTAPPTGLSEVSPSGDSPRGAAFTASQSPAHKERAFCIKDPQACL